MHTKAATAIFLLPTLLLAENSSQFSGSLLWEISGNGLNSSSYILGTHHLASDIFAKQMPGLDNVLNQVDRVVGEIVISDMGLIRTELRESMYLPENMDYSQLLSDQEYTALDTGIREVLGAGLEKFGRHHPAILSMMYASAITTQAISEDYIGGKMSIDEYVQAEAIARGKKVMGLESTGEQIEVALNTEDISSMAIMLVDVVKDPEANRQAAAKLFDLYVQNELEAVYNQSLSVSEPYNMSVKYQNALNKERNDKWLQKLPTIMSEASSLIAVGALHLCGEEGLLQRLSAMGYTVTPIR